MEKSYERGKAGGKKMKMTKELEDLKRQFILPVEVENVEESIRFLVERGVSVVVTDNEVSDVIFSKKPPRQKDFKYFKKRAIETFEQLKELEKQSQVAKK